MLFLKYHRRFRDILCQEKRLLVVHGETTPFRKLSLDEELRFP